MTKASARSFRLMRSLGGDPFNFTQINGTATFLKETLTGTSSVNDLSSAAGQYPGSWTLPVCDMSGYGSSWNFDYEAPIFVKTAVNSHPPCLCGKTLHAPQRCPKHTDFSLFSHRTRRQRNVRLGKSGGDAGIRDVLEPLRERADQQDLPVAGRGHAGSVSRER